MKHKTSKLLSTLLALVMVLGLAPAMSVPAAAGENDGGKAIVLGTGVLDGPTEVTDDQEPNKKHYTPNSYVWFGTYPQAELNDVAGLTEGVDYISANGKNYSIDPIKWRVLDAEKANDGTTKGAFLLSEYLLARRVKFEAAWDYDDEDGQTKPNDWQKSDGQAWCSAFASNLSNFTPTEQAAMLGVNKTDSAENSLYGLWCGESGLTTADKVFFLSVRELANYVGNYYTAPGLTAFDDGGSAGVWWLRSPNLDDDGIHAGAVNADGYVYYYYVIDDWSARPAFNLNLESVLFASAAVGGKAGTTGALSEIGDDTENEWKLTLKDENRKFFDVKEKKKKVASGGTVRLNYTDATVKTDEAPNEWISAIIADEDGNALYYGRLTQPKKAEDDVEVKIPELENGEYILKLFSEQYNGDYKTDYASDFQDVKLTVVPTPVEYDLWLGNTRVTEKNKNDILNDGGKAKYDPTTGVLTLNNPSITEAHSEGSAVIFCSEDGPLTINGKAILGVDGAEYGIRHQGEGALTINGNISASGINGGIYAPFADINITGGEVKAIATFKASPSNFGGCNALYTEGKLTVSGGALTADATNVGQNIGIYAQGGVEISGGELTAQGNQYGISVGENANITVGNGIKSVWAMGDKAMNVGNGKINIGNRLDFKMPDDSRYHSVAGVKLNNDKNQVLDGNGQVAKVVNLLPITSGGGGGGGGGAATEQYTLTYNTGGGSSIAATKHEKNATVNLTAIPAREGYDFTGWYADKELKNAVTSVKMDDNKTVYAGWKEIPIFVVTIDSTIYQLNGKTMTMDSAPFIDGNNRTMLPVRVIANALGISNDNIKWDSATKTASFTRADGKVVSCTVNSNVIKVGDENVTIDTVPVTRNGRIYLPMRALFNAFGVPDENILWDAAARTVTVTKKD